MRLFTLLFLTLLCTCVRAQDILTGVVIDNTSGNPLPYVNVFLESNQARGVLTNEKGEYEIQLTESDHGDRLLFSLLSYKTHVEPVAGVLKKGFFNLQMKTSFISLGEVVVISDLGLRGLIKKVFTAISDNYGTDDFVLTAYSRNYQIDGGKYTQFVEAMVNIRDQQYGTRDKNGRRPMFKTKVAEFRMERDTIPTLMDRWPLLGHQWKLAGFYGSNAMRIGGLKYKKRNIDFLEEYTFANRGEYLSGTDTLVRVSYFPLNDETETGQADEEFRDNNWFMGGEFLINKNDLAVVSYTLGDAKRGHFEDVTYQKVNGKYYLKQQTWYIELEYDNDTRQFIDHQMVYVTKVTTGKKEVRKAFSGKSIVAGEDLTDLRVKYNPDFWREHKMLRSLGAPEEMRLSMERIQRKVEGRKKRGKGVERDTM